MNIFAAFETPLDRYATLQNLFMIMFNVLDETAHTLWGVKLEWEQMKTFPEVAPLCCPQTRK
jgi:hypothetical protein